MGISGYEQRVLIAARMLVYRAVAAKMAGLPYT